MIQNKVTKRSMKWWTKAISGFSLFAIIAVFGYMKMSFIIEGAKIVAQAEHRDNTSLVEIKGNAKNANYVSLNGREIFIDKDGDFKEVVALLPGFSVVTLDTEDKFGNKSEKKFEMIYKEKESVAINGNVKIIN